MRKTWTRTLIMPCLTGLIAACGTATTPDPSDATASTSEQAPAPTLPESFGPVITETAFNCGAERLVTDFHENGIAIRSDKVGSVFLPQVISASGAKYEGETASGVMVFWNKGDEATVWIDDAQWPLCRQENPELTQMDILDAMVMQEWVVENLMGAGIPDNAHATLNFSDDNKVSGSTGCNQYSGSFEIQGETLVFGPMMSTRRACVGALMDMEQKFLSVFSAPVRVSMDSTGLLRLDSEAGSLEAR